MTPVLPGGDRAAGGAGDGVPGPAPVITGMGVSVPTAVSQQRLWDEFFAAHYRGGPDRDLARRIFANAGVSTRHAAVNPLLEDVSGWSTGRRMGRYLAEAMPLGAAAVSAALDDAGVAPRELGLFTVCSCTGYVTPGLDILLARDLGLSPDCQRLFVGHMGCYAALPGLAAARDFVRTHGRPAVLLCVELPSLHMQPGAVDPGQVVAHALFSDAAAAAVVTPGGDGYEVCGIASLTDPDSAHHMTWDVTDAGFRMGLSPRVPEVLGAHVGRFLNRLLAGHGLTAADVPGWAVHPGGPQILDVVERELGLPGAVLEPSRAVLAGYGNCSSPTVLIILDRLRRMSAPPFVTMTAFGPGLTLYAALLRRRPAG